jgi:hypothetical protein
MMQLEYQQPLLTYIHFFFQGKEFQHFFSVDDHNGSALNANLTLTIRIFPCRLVHSIEVLHGKYLPFIDSDLIY